MKPTFSMFAKPLGAFISRLSQFRNFRHISKQSIAMHFAERYGWALVGLLAAGLAFWLTVRYAENQVHAERAKSMPRGGMVEILVAARDLGRGDLVSPQTVAIRKIPAEWSLPSNLRPSEFDAVNQSPLTQAIKSGFPLSLESLKPAATDQKASASLEPGFRAISIPVDEVSSVGGLIQPGDRVDLWVGSQMAIEQQSISDVSARGKSAAQPAQMLAENLRVLATGQTTEAASGPPGPLRPGLAYASMTLAVPASIAGAVLGGQLQGRLGVSLRSARQPAVVAKGSGAKALANPAVEILIGGMEGGL